MNKPRVAILHYTAPPVVGGVEAVIRAHVRVLHRAGYPGTVLAGRGNPAALAPDAELILVPEMDSQQPEIVDASTALAAGRTPPVFANLKERARAALEPHLGRFDAVIVHNIFGKHFNLPLTAALCELLDAGKLRRCIAWGHDFSWTSPSSRRAVHAGYPWDLLRTQRGDITYVAVSQRRQRELADLFGCPADEIRVIYNGVDPQELLGLSSQGMRLAERLGLFVSGLVLLMPVRVTQAKNIEYALRVVAALKRLSCAPKLILTGPPDPHDAASMAYFESLRALRRQLDVEDEMRFVFESGPQPGTPLEIESRVVGDLYRLSDVLFMPSHREGFGMPVLEAGLAGLPVACTAIPAAEEIAGEDVILFDAAETPEEVAARILDRVEGSPVYRLRRRVRGRYTWDAIFERDIAPLLL